MANNLMFTDEEMAVDEAVGYPKAYAKLCRERSFGPFSNGPPFAFIPYALVPQEDSREKELDEMFPIIDSKAKPTNRPKIFLNLIWKQLNHLGNAGFDPEMFRIDTYGNVLYYHADAASPLAWDFDHWFPCSRGGLTVPSNLRILQWQVCRRKQNKLEFLIPWWDLQLGVSVNQFLSIFASSNSDFRRRAFSWLFYEGESEELNPSQTVDSHSFPQHFLESKEKLGLAPAAVVLSRWESFDAPLKSLDVNRRPRSNTPIIGARKLKELPKENEDPMMVSNPYQAIVMARDSLRQREVAVKMQAEIQKLDNDVSELQQKTGEEKLSIQELEMTLIKKRRRAEKCRRLAESQSSYKAMLEKMIRDAMHQSVVYKEQVRLNQAAATALLARLEAQRAICDSAERELRRKYKKRDELEKQIRPEWEQARKRSRMVDTLDEEKEDRINLCLPGNESKFSQETTMNDITRVANAKKIILSQQKNSAAPLHKELRKFLEEEQKLSAELLRLEEERELEEHEGCIEVASRINILKPDNKGKNKLIVGNEKNYAIEESLEKLDTLYGGNVYGIRFPMDHQPENEENEESRNERGKGNIEKWLQFLLENAPEDGEFKISRSRESQCEKEIEEIENQQEVLNKDDEITAETAALDSREPILETEKEDAEKRVVVMHSSKTPMKNPPYRIDTEKTKVNELASSNKSRRMSVSDENVGKEKIGNQRELLRSESSRAFRRIPSSPSLILSGMKKRVDCIGKKPSVFDDDDDLDAAEAARNSFFKSSIRTIKKAVRI